MLIPSRLSYWNAYQRERWMQQMPASCWLATLNASSTLVPSSAEVSMKLSVCFSAKSRASSVGTCLAHPHEDARVIAMSAHAALLRTASEMMRRIYGNVESAEGPRLPEVLEIALVADQLHPRPGYISALLSKTVPHTSAQPRRRSWRGCRSGVAGGGDGPGSMLRLE